MNQRTVAAIRRNLGLTVDELAFILRVSAREVMAWESGLHTIPALYASHLTRFNNQGLGIFANR